MKLEDLKTPKDLLSEEDFEKYSNALYPLGVPILHETLLTKLKDDPDYEVWVPLVHYKFAPYTRRSDPRLVISDPTILVSNRGRMVSLRRKEPKILAPAGDVVGYISMTIKIAGRFEALVAHRTVACNFIPLPPMFSVPTELQVNHIDGDKKNISLSNLEWVTAEQNMRHAHETKLIVIPKGFSNSKSKPAKATILEGDHAGYQFVVAGNEIQTHLGFRSASIWQVCNGVAKTHMGCSWEYATEEEIKTLPRTPPLDMIFTPIGRGRPRKVA